MEQLKGIGKQRHCSVNSTRSSDESNQSKQHRYKNLSWGSHLQDSDVHDDVRSLVHCKFNDDQGKIGLISFMKTVTADRGSWTKRQGERC